MSSVSNMASSPAGSQARLLIGMSLGKICRGGGAGGLRRNLLVATVLQKARLVFVEETSRAGMQQLAERKQQQKVVENDSSENAKLSRVSGTNNGSLDTRLRQSEEKSVCVVSVRGEKRPCEERTKNDRVKRVRFDSPVPRLVSVAV